MNPPQLLATCLIGLAAHTGGLAQPNISNQANNQSARLSEVAPPAVQFAASAYTVAEDAGNVTVTIQRTGGLDLRSNVDYATADGSATQGLKYGAVSGTLIFEAGETNKVIVVPILNDGFVDGTKSFQVLLSNPNGGIILGAHASAIVSITSNDVGIQFQFATYSVAEDAGSLLIAVVRGDDGTLPVTADFATANRSATSGLDYTGTTNMLAFEPPERLKLISIPILNDHLREANKTFRVTLTNAAGAALGSQKAATVTIVDNDAGFEFEFASYAVAENAGMARIRVLRGTDDTNSTVTVDFATTDLNATKGLDYTDTTETLSFAAGETVKLVANAISNDGVREPLKNFRVTLSNPTGGAVLGSRKTANVSIGDDDPGVGFELGRYTVWENAGAITLTVLRGNDVALGPITVDYATSNLTARAGQDYQAAFGTVVFMESETVKTVLIPILRSDSVTSDTTFRVTLNNLTGVASLGTASTTVNILNAPELGTFGTVAPPFDIALNIHREGDVNILTWRGGGPLQRADCPTGPWETLTSATTPLAVQSPLLATFYRVTRPRPVNLYIPSRYDDRAPAPLVIHLHGYGFTGDGSEEYLQLRTLAESRGFLYCCPDGTIDIDHVRFWNGTDACCDFYNAGTDDTGYLRTLIEEIGRRFSVDRKRIHLIGYSNGGFMAYHMACHSADLIAGIASLEGMTFRDSSRCAPSERVNILNIHGTADNTALYAGNAAAGIPNTYPGALQTVQMWAGYNGATGPVTDPGPSMDLDLNVSGLDAVITRYTNYPPGGAVELWTIKGGSHAPTFNGGSHFSEFAPRVIDWLLAHPKP